MENRIDIDIDDIRIITRKREADRFCFSCRDRVADGFVYFIRGNGIFTDGEGRVYPVGDSTAILLCRGESYSFDVAADCEYITSSYTITRDSAASLSLLPRTVILDEGQAFLLERINREWQALRPESYMKCRIWLLSWYMQLLQDADRRKTARDPAVLRAIEFIHSNFKRNFSGNELALYCSQSISHLRVKFRNALGMGITAYRDELRMRAARQMLASRLFSPKETAYELGYSDVYHFTKAFAAATGIPPSRFARHTEE